MYPPMWSFGHFMFVFLMAFGKPLKLVVVRREGRAMTKGFIYHKAITLLGKEVLEGWLGLKMAVKAVVSSKLHPR
jgi:hypothetical protein